MGYRHTEKALSFLFLLVFSGTLPALGVSELDQLNTVVYQPRVIEEPDRFLFELVPGVLPPSRTTTVPQDYLSVNDGDIFFLLEVDHDFGGRQILGAELAVSGPDVGPLLRATEEAAAFDGYVVGDEDELIDVVALTYGFNIDRDFATRFLEFWGPDRELQPLEVEELTELAKLGLQSEKIFIDLIAE